MPANFERVNRNTPCTQADMTALAGRANSSTVLGKPYNFSPTGTWRTELVRLRGNILKKLQFFEVQNPNFNPPYNQSYPYRQQAIVSGPWAFHSVALNNALPVTAGFGQQVGQYPHFTNISGQGFQFNEVEYIYPGPAGQSMKLQIVLQQGPPIKTPYYARDSKERWEGNVDPNRSTGTFEVEIKTGGLSGRFKGFLLFLFQGPISTSQVDLSCTLPATMAVGSGGIRVSFDTTFGGGLFSCKLTRKAGAPPWQAFSPVIDQQAGDTLWEHTVDTPEICGAVDGSRTPYKLSAPAFLTRATNHNFGAFVPGTPDGGYKEEESFPGSGSFQRWFGNQANIRLTPSAAITTSGIWKAKSIPIEGGLHNGNFNPHAGDSTTATEDIPAISTATEFQIPAYHWKRDTDTDPIAFPVIPGGQQAGYGWTINEVHIRRNPVQDGDYYFPDTTDPVTVEIGCIRNGAFVAFQTVAIPAGTAATTIYPFWPIFSRDYLVYRCDSRMQIYARVISTITGTAFNQGRGAAVNLPILSNHYNDTMAMLEAIADLGL